MLDATAALTGEGGWGPGAAVARTYAPMAGSGTCVPDLSRSSSQRDLEIKGDDRERMVRETTTSGQHGQ